MRLLNHIRRHRGFIRLLNIEALSRALAEPCADPALRARLASELTVRAWLYAGGGDWASLPERGAVESGWRSFGLPESAQNLLTRWLCEQGARRRYALPDTVKTGSLFVDFLKRDMGDYEHAHGVMPFVFHGEHPDVDPVVVLPFMVRSSSVCRVTTADGKELPLLREGVERAMQGLVTCGHLKADAFFRVILTSLHDPGIKLEGQSLGLPVMVARYFMLKKVEMRALAVGLSGCLDHGGRLDVETRKANGTKVKAERLARYGIPVRVFAADAEAEFATESWPVAQDLQSSLESLCQQVLLLPPEHRRPMEDPGARLDAIGKGMRFGGISAQQALAELAHIETSLEDRSDCLTQHHQLVLKGLQASALCHLGRADDSARVTGELIRLRCELGAEYIAEALVRHAVNLTDFADYGQAVVYADDAFQVARHLCFHERSDVELKALSSKAQALTAWALIDSAKAAEARELSFKAVAMARALDSISPAAEKNVPRNLVYAYLWHALHDPASARGMEDDVREAAVSDAKTWPYFLRVRWMAGYRLARAGGATADWMRHENELPAADAEGGWLHALSCKYRGTLLAECGRWPEARQDFQVAASLLRLADSCPLLAFLGATAALQAGETLMRSCPEEARAHVHGALTMFRRMGDWFVAPELATPTWIARAEGLLAGSDVATLPDPQAYFPY